LDLLRNRKIRRIVSVTLMATGAIALFLSPNSTEGAILFVLGLSLEIAGMYVEHH
jgi:hypothetical protein